MTTQLQESNSANVARFLGLRAAQEPDALAVAAPKDGDFESIDFGKMLGELNQNNSCRQCKYSGLTRMALR